MRRPRVKPEHTAHRFDDGTIRIGGEIYGIAAEITDPHGWVWAALTKLDGTASPEVVEKELAAEHPRLGPEGAAKLLRDLLNSGYVEDAAVGPPTGLTDAEIERYSRNHAYFRRVDLRPGSDPWEAQWRLKFARVAVLGVGGTGSHAAWALAAAGVGSLHLVDPDSVELSNLTRQALYGEADLGRPKAEVAAERLAGVNSTGTFTHDVRMVDTEEGLRKLVSGCDAFALCADEPRNDLIAKMTSRVCAALGVPWVSAGYNGPLVTVGVYGPQGPCFECVGAGEEAKLRPGWHPDLGGAGVLAPAAGISGQLIAHEVIALLTGTNRSAPGFVRGLNLIAPDQLVDVRHPARPDCRLCNP
ncbi:HesA/MoeB/ThiF family protein [Streptomyces sp. GQFP]|uniref:HesA/MoeB/ThiF family protein n=1 Tax=Streptomyces sp. GQFP TaxID=2907545 RepID=UPI001F2DE829|nr:ThiF family adenylyltransferase [Streptomyces sp. GQFP]UIX31003.1 ThiF family adenylyltransferase [Streptomyces sp. GQFP]